MTDTNTELDALDAFLDALRAEFRSNPELSYRVLKALPTNIHFDAATASKFANPIELVAGKSDEDARASFNGFSLAQLKLIATSNNIATSLDLKGLKQDQVLDLIIERCQRKIRERTS